MIDFVLDFLRAFKQTQLRHSAFAALAALCLCCAATPSALAEGRAVTLTVTSLGNSTVRAQCTLNPRTARKARQIMIGRAYGSATSYSVIASTKRRVLGIRTTSRLTAPGEYRFLCRVTLARRYLWSNGVKLILRQPAKPTPRPTAKPTPRPTPRPTATPTPELSACPSSYKNEVFQRVNQARAGLGKWALKYNSQLEAAAQGHTNNMAKAQNLDHGTLEQMMARIRAAGFMGSPVGENIAYGQTTPSQVMTSWLNSQGHYENIMGIKYNFNYIGIGCVKDRYGRYWWTQNFGG